MALINLGGGVTDIRGSIGGTCFSRGPAGNYARARRKPINPRSNAQMLVRANLGRLTDDWSTVLTEPERESWRQYASGTNFKNALGQTIKITGLAAFLRTSALLLLIGEDVQETAPVETGQAGPLSYEFSIDAAEQEISIDVINPPWDKDTNDDHAIFFMGLPNPAGRLALPRLWKYLTVVTGNSVTPPTLPKEVDSVFNFVETQVIYLASVHVDPLGRVSTRIHLVQTPPLP